MAIKETLIASGSYNIMKVLLFSCYGHLEHFTLLIKDILEFINEVEPFLIHGHNQDCIF
jgi:hypothetical protein